MKSKNILLTTLIVCAYDIPSYAQFNTIGRVTPNRVVTKQKPQETPNEVPGDSIVSNDSIATYNNRMVADSSLNAFDADSTFRAHDILEQYMSVSYPLKSVHVGSGFGIRKHPIMHKYMMHNGVDLQARYEDVYSMFPGTVIAVSKDGRSGKYVTVKSANYTISYCHLSAQLVKKGTFVKAGELIAKSGNTGMSTGPHLHLTTKKDGKAINPTILLDYVHRIKSKFLEYMGL